MNTLLSKAGKHSDLAAAGAVVLVIAMMIIPLPPFLLDFFITMNISAALMIVVATMYVPRALDFSSFPSVLLLTTLFRLAINVSMTRLILLHGNAGHVIEAFGNFVVGGNVVVGLVVFLILIVIQFVVITNGAGRVAEVGARFTLDAMPGKQMAIDADLNAGPDHRRGGAPPPRRGRPGGRLLRRDGRRFEVRQGRRHGRPASSRRSTSSAASSSASSSRRCPSPRPASTSRCCRSATASCAQIPALLISVATGILVTRSAGTRTTSARRSPRRSSTSARRR